MGTGIFAFGALITLLESCDISRQKYANEQFVSTKAVITRVDIDRNRSQAGVVSYEPEITYKYEVEGEEYIEDHIDRTLFGSRYDSDEEAQEFIDEHNFYVGKKIKIYYDPDDVRDAVIFKHIDDNAERDNRGRLFAGFIVYVLPLYLVALIWFAVRKIRGLLNKDEAKPPKKKKFFGRKKIEKD